MMNFFVVAAAAASLASNAIARPIQPRGFSGGDVTFYGGGLTACGIDLKTKSQDGVAVSFNVFDSFPAVRVGNPNKNPICQAKIKAFLPSTGKTITIPVVDKCSGCKDADLDLSHQAFLAIGLEFPQGRVAGVQWEFVGGDDSGGSDDSNDDTAPTSTKQATTEAPAPTTLLPVGNVGAGPSDSETTETTETPEATKTAEESTETATEVETPETETEAEAEPTDTEAETEPTETDSGDIEPIETEEAEPISTGGTQPTTSLGACIEAWNTCNQAYTGSAEDARNYKCHTDYAACSKNSLPSARMNKNRMITF